MSIESADHERTVPSVQPSLSQVPGTSSLQTSDASSAADRLPVCQCQQNAALWQAGQLDQILRQLTDDLIRSEATGDRLGLLDATNDIACVYRMQGEHLSASQFQAQAAVREMELLGSRRLSATSLSNLACDALLNGDWPIAEGLFWKSLLAELAAGNESGAAADWANLGLLAGLQGDHEQSRYCLWEALKLHRRAGDQLSLGMDLWHLGQSFEETGDWSLSARLFQRAELKFLQIGNNEFRIEARDRKESAKARLQVTTFDVQRN
ncbi:MAG: hypothetical protein JWM11_6477 [Planctomycetaceae bacterium]|nr:hypothetical protein [Planctomycetaceae bacterium]